MNGPHRSSLSRDECSFLVAWASFEGVDPNLGSDAELDELLREWGVPLRDCQGAVLLSQGCQPFATLEAARVLISLIADDEGLAIPCARGKRSAA